MKLNGISLAVVMAGMAAAGSAQAGGYMGVELGYSKFLSRDNSGYSYTDTDTDPVSGNPVPVTFNIHNIKAEGALGGAFYAGWRSDLMPFLAELEYLDLGSHSLTGDSTETGSNINTTRHLEDQLKFKGVNASIGVLPWRGRDGSALWLKAGYYNGDTADKFTTFNGIDGSLSRKSTGASAGVGLDLMLTREVGVRAAFETLINARDFSGPDLGGKSMLSMASVGMTLAFGGPAPAAPAVIYTPAATPAAAPIPAPMAEPVAAPVPVAAPAPIALTGSTLHAGTVMRTRPTLDAPIASTMRAETPAQLTTHIVNATGGWWFVKSGNLQGWVQDAQVSR